MAGVRARVFASWLGFAAIVVACGSSSRNGFSGDAGDDGANEGGAGDGGTDTGCAAPRAVCGGACVDVSSDPANCGACGQACGAAASCCGGACATSCSFVLSSIDPAQAYQNGGAFITLHGAGFQSGMRVTVGDARAPVWALDAKTARIVAPPAPVGTYDVTIALGMNTSTLKGAMLYKAGGLLTPWLQKPMSSVRGEAPGVTVTQDGRVLIAGGTLTPDVSTKSLATADVFDRKNNDATHAVKTTQSISRWRNTAITLLDGRVLVVGGGCQPDLSGCVGDPTKADLFDPTTETFSPTPAPLNKPRVGTMAVLLPDGRALVASSNDPSLEVFDPATNQFTLVPHAQPHPFGFMVRMRDGRILLGGGAPLDNSIPPVAAVEVIDPDTLTFSPVGSLTTARGLPTAHVLPDGRTLVIAGTSVSTGCGVPLSSIEEVDAKAQGVKPSAMKLGTTRCWAASALVRDGSILVMGGYDTGQCGGGGITATTERIDPVAGKVAPFAPLPNANAEWNAVTLLDGSVLGVGGGSCGTPTALPDLDFLPADPNSQ
jgi:hypothetical protein